MRATKNIEGEREMGIWGNGAQQARKTCTARTSCLSSGQDDYILHDKQEYSTCDRDCFTVIYLLCDQQEYSVCDMELKEVEAEDSTSLHEQKLTVKCTNIMKPQIKWYLHLSVCPPVLVHAYIHITLHGYHHNIYRTLQPAF